MFFSEVKTFTQGDYRSTEYHIHRWWLGENAETLKRSLMHASSGIKSTPKTSLPELLWSSISCTQMQNYINYRMSNHSDDIFTWQRWNILSCKHWGGVDWRGSLLSFDNNWSQMKWSEVKWSSSLLILFGSRYVMTFHFETSAKGSQLIEGQKFKHFSSRGIQIKAFLTDVLRFLLEPSPPSPMNGCLSTPL